MDPNATIKEIRTILNNRADGQCSIDDLDRLADLVEYIDEWMAKGGSAPDSWDQHPRW